MGIRFFCPNGHKLNVKEFQAGRLGICPFCGARIQIPTQSTRPGSKSAGRQSAAQAATQTLEHDDSESAQASDSSPDILPGEPPSLPGDPDGGKMLGPSMPVGTPVRQRPGSRSADPFGGGRSAAAGAAAAGDARLRSGRHAGGRVNLRSAPLPQPTPASRPALRNQLLRPRPAGRAQHGAGISRSNGDGGSRRARPAPPAPRNPPAPEPADPIAEAPEMIWYVRPPSGGQFGPAAGDLMRTWLSEGRVSADSLVWREGWRDWQEAGKVFPKLRSNQIIDFLETTPVVRRRRSPAAHVHRPKVKRLPIATRLRCWSG